MKSARIAVLLLAFASSAGCERKQAQNPPEAVSDSNAERIDTPAPESAADSAPADVIREYYAAINARDYRRAYAMWGDSGRDSKQTFEQFNAGFSETATVHGAIGEPGPIEGAAGSRYIDIPVFISATRKDGTKERFRGKYTLRRSVVTGATEAQQHWHIYSAEIARTR